MLEISVCFSWTLDTLTSLLVLFSSASSLAVVTMCLKYIFVTTQKSRESDHYLVIIYL